MALELFVSPVGNDLNGTGSRELPFASLERARQAAAGKGRADSPVRIQVGAGKYFLSSPLHLGAEDSFTEYVGHGAILTGAMNLGRLIWKPYGEQLWEAAVPAHLSIDQLFINGQQMIMARFPNFDAAQPLQGSTTQEAIRERSRRWAHPETGFLRALHINKWGGNSYKITGKDDSALGLSYLWAGDNNRGGEMHPQFIMAENIFEELDSPGEWFYDAEAGRLFVYPTEGMTLSSAEIEAAAAEELLHLEGSSPETVVQGVSFQGFTFENTSRTLFTGRYIPLMRGDWCVVRSGAIFCKNAENISFKENTLRHIGGNGLFLSGHADQILFDHNEMAHIGSSGILVAGDPNACREPSFWDAYPTPEAEPFSIHKTTIDDTIPGPKAELYPKNIVISNNHIFDVGIWEKQSSHVAVSVAFRVAICHNTFHCGPRAGININDGTFGGHEIAFNDIFDVQRETDDHGMFNSWGRDRFWSLGEFDTLGCHGAEKEKFSLLDVIEPIRIHDNRMHFNARLDGGPTFGIDLDDGSSNYEIFNNLCLNMGIKLREGFHRKVSNNILLNAPFNLHCTFENSFDCIERNIVLFSVPYSLSSSYERFSVSQTRIDRNCFYAFGAEIQFPDYWPQLAYDSHSVQADPIFADPASNDYTVTNQKLMEQIGFQNFDMHQFGQPGCPVQAPIFKITALKSIQARDLDSYWGAAVCSVDASIMSAAGAGSEEGVSFQAVPDDSIAARYGLRTADVVQKVSGQAVKNKDHFISLMAKIEQGTAVTLHIVRNQLRKTLSFTLE